MIPLRSESKHSITQVSALVSLLLIAASAAKADYTNCLAQPAGLVSWWRGEGSLADALGNNPGTTATDVGYALGETGWSFLFNGVTSWFEAPASPTLDVGQGSGLTVEAWINPTGNGTYPIVEWSSPTDYGVHLWVFSTGCLYANVVDTTRMNHVFQSPNNIVAPGQFQHVALTYDQVSGVARLFLNGTVVAQSSVGTFTPVTSSDFYVGHRLPGLVSGPAFFNGLIDKLSLYNRALTTNEISAIYAAGAAGKCIGTLALTLEQPLTNQTVFEGEWPALATIADGSPPLNCLWTFNTTNILATNGPILVLPEVRLSQAGTYSVQISDASSSISGGDATLTVLPVPPCTNPPPGLISSWRGDGDANDSVGAHNGLLNNGASFALGLVRHAFALNGTNQLILVSNAPALNPTTGLTIETWINPASNPSNTMGILTKDDGSANRQYMLNLVMSAQGQPVLQANVRTATGLTTLTGTNTVQLNSWTHAAMTYDGSSLKLYFNGALDTNQTLTGPLVTTTQPVRIGCDSPANFFNGLIDEVSLYSRALASQEIASIYNAAAGGKCHIAIPPFFIAQLTNQTVTLGLNANFSVTAGGSVPLSYRWNFNGTPIPGATSSSLLLTNVQFTNAGTYSVLVSNSTGVSVTSSNGVLTLTYPPAAVRLSPTNAAGGGPVTVPVTLVANGNENALGFSVNFDPTKLSYVGAAVGPSAASAILLSNTSQTNSGRIGLAIALPPGASFNSGTQQVVWINFTAAVLTNAASTSLSFGDAPTLRQLLDTQLNTLAANYGPSVTIPISAAIFEGDLFPRPTGDQALNLADWLLMGRYVARLDYPTNSFEFQKADCAPRATRGDGAITVSDWVQLGRYAFGLDPWSVAAGPTNELTITGPGPSDSRFITVSSANITNGQPVTVSVAVQAQGNENALAGTLSFSSQVSFLGATLGADAAGMTLYLNTNQLAFQRVGFAMALGTGSALPTGTAELLRLSFRANTSGSFGPNWIDVPVPREVSDPNATALPATYGTLLIPVSPPPPSLTIARSGTNIVLSWPLRTPGFSLQEATGALPPKTTWTNLAVTPVLSNSYQLVVLPIGPAPKFYRLSQ
jgi:hypothetical protein